MDKVLTSETWRIWQSLRQGIIQAIAGVPMQARVQMPEGNGTDDWKERTYIIRFLKGETLKITAASWKPLKTHIQFLDGHGSVVAQFLSSQVSVWSEDIAQSYDGGTVRFVLERIGEEKIKTEKEEKNE